jgi:glycosyltransferase involved in cell wall biosynthesis
VIRYSLVIPAHNAARHLDQVLQPLLQLGPAWEVLLVDDASQDGTAEKLQNYPFHILVQPERAGQSRARNLGARAARGEILVFMDSDVLVEAPTLQGMAETLEQSPHLDGLFGCYGQLGNPGEPSVSRFRNLWHRRVHQSLAGPVRSFWAGLGAIRKSTFLSVQGFDPRLDGIEDVELGSRICRLGGRFRLDPGFEGRHLKHWSLASMVYTDTWVRAAPWTYYAWQGLTPKTGLNLSPRFALAPVLLLTTLLLLPWQSQLALICWTAYLLSNLPHYGYFAAAGGGRLGLLSVYYLMVHHGCCLLGALIGTSGYLRDRLHRR